MNNRQQAREEALFVLLMEQVARQQDRQARQLGRALEEDPEAALSPALQQRCMQTLRRGFRRRVQQAWRDPRCPVHLRNLHHQRNPARGLRSCPRRI